MASTTTLVVYSDASQHSDAIYTCANSSTADAPASNTGDTAGWGHRWILSDGDNVDPGEVVEFSVNVQQIGLAANTPFKLELIPGKGAVITIERTTPLEIKTIMDLD